jgi:Cu+-exporting ATPase
MNKFIVLLVLFIGLISCEAGKKNPKEENKAVETSEVAANLKSIEVDIEGMTCEIGCARTIQSKLSKVDGVTYSKVDFESKKGIFTFDANKIGEKDLTTKINGIAGGDVYVVASVTELDKIIN